jgi:hypothetical protein
VSSGYASFEMNVFAQKLLRIFFRSAVPDNTPVVSGTGRPPKPESVAPYGATLREAELAIKSFGLGPAHYPDFFNATGFRFPVPVEVVMNTPPSLSISVVVADKSTGKANLPAYDDFFSEFRRMVKAIDEEVKKPGRMVLKPESNLPCFARWVRYCDFNNISSKNTFGNFTPKNCRFLQSLQKEK